MYSYPLIFCQTAVFLKGGLQCCQLIFRDTLAVVGHLDNQLLLFLPCADGDIPGLPAALEAVDNGVFHHGLYAHPRHQMIHYIFRYVDLIMQPVAETDLLYRQVIFRMGDLVPQSDQRLFAGDVIAQCFSQRSGHHRKLRDLMEICHRRHGLQDIIEKMGVHLGLEGPDLRVLLLKRRLVFVVNGKLQLVHQGVEAVSQAGDLVTAGDCHPLV